MKKASVYTRGGDTGKTSLVSGTRVSKGSDRLDLYGHVDSLNSYIGLMLANITGDLEFESDISFIEKIQSKLFDMGSLLACEKEFHEKFNLNSFSEDHIKDIERMIDKYDSILEPLNSFILPGGSIAASVAHVCRTHCRELERKLVSYDEQNIGQLSSYLMIYINRLSDFFFIFARYLNRVKKINETKWSSH